MTRSRASSSSSLSARNTSAPAARSSGLRAARSLGGDATGCGLQAERPRRHRPRCLKRAGSPPHLGSSGSPTANRSAAWIAHCARHEWKSSASDSHTVSTVVGRPTCARTAQRLAVVWHALSPSVPLHEPRRLALPVWGEAGRCAASSPPIPSRPTHKHTRALGPMAPTRGHAAWRLRYSPGRAPHNAHSASRAECQTAEASTARTRLSSASPPTPRGTPRRAAASARRHRPARRAR
eukprot:6243028-Prymnesium_polylepis.1